MGAEPPVLFEPLPCPPPGGGGGGGSCAIATFMNVHEIKIRSIRVAALIIFFIANYNYFNICIFKLCTWLELKILTI